MFASDFGSEHLVIDFHRFRTLQALHANMPWLIRKRAQIRVGDSGDFDIVRFQCGQQRTCHFCHGRKSVRQSFHATFETVASRPSIAEVTIASRI